MSAVHSVMKVRKAQPAPLQVELCPSLALVMKGKEVGQFPQGHRVSRESKPEQRLALGASLVCINALVFCKSANFG